MVINGGSDITSITNIFSNGLQKMDYSLSSTDAGSDESTETASMWAHKSLRMRAVQMHTNTRARKHTCTHTVVMTKGGSSLEDRPLTTNLIWIL